MKRTRTQPGELHHFRQVQVVGVVSRNDLELFLSKAPSPGVMKRQHNIEQVMVTAVITVSPDHPLEEAARQRRMAMWKSAELRISLFTK